MSLNLQALINAVKAVAPIEGIRPFNGEIIIDFIEAEATPEHRTAALEVVANWVDPPPPPDFPGFIDALVSIEGFYGELSNSPMASLINNRLARLAEGNSWQGASDPLISLWNGSPPALNPAQRTALTDIAQQHNLTLQISETNTLSAA